MLPSILEKGYKLFTDSEIDYLKENIYKRGEKYIDKNSEGKLKSHYYTWKFYKKEFLDIKEILETKISNVIGKELIFDHSHILHSFLPYGLHSDYYQTKMFNNNDIVPAYTIIIPLDDYDSSTFVFNQYDEDKALKNIDKTKVLEDCTDNKTRQLISHCKDELFDYISVKERFKWTKGSMHACDRRYIHCSDNYTSSENFKTAIIFWTSMKKEQYNV
tara:strand:+ start:162 stop:812 length:651 start_codon:yes stop_codon:yes gene_type:complete